MALFTPRVKVWHHLPCSLWTLMFHNYSTPALQPHRLSAISWGLQAHSYFRAFALDAPAVFLRYTDSVFPSFSRSLLNCHFSGRPHITNHHKLNLTILTHSNQYLPPPLVFVIFLHGIFSITHTQHIYSLYPPNLKATWQIPAFVYKACWSEWIWILKFYDTQRVLCTQATLQTDFVTVIYCSDKIETNEISNTRGLAVKNY